LPPSPPLFPYTTLFRSQWIGQLQAGTFTPPPPRRADLTKTASAVQQHLLEIFLPFLEFFAAHEDLSRDCAAAMIRVRGEPEVFRDRKSTRLNSSHVSSS